MILFAPIMAKEENPISISEEALGTAAIAVVSTAATYFTGSTESLLILPPLSTALTLGVLENERAKANYRKSRGRRRLFERVRHFISHETTTTSLGALAGYAFGGYEGSMYGALAGAGLGLLTESVSLNPVRLKLIRPNKS